jgi:hypothetical protein
MYDMGMWQDQRRFLIASRCVWSVGLLAVCGYILILGTGSEDAYRYFSVALTVVAALCGFMGFVLRQLSQLPRRR